MLFGCRTNKEGPRRVASTSARSRYASRFAGKGSIR